MSRLQLNPNTDVEFCFKQEQADGSVIEYSGTAKGMSLEVEQDYDTIYSEYNTLMPKRYQNDTTVTAKFHNPEGIYKKTSKIGVVRTATVVVDKLTPANIDEARRKANVSSDFEFSVEEKRDLPRDERVGYSIKFVWTE